MKKNMMMRIASVLLIAVLMSTSAISGTYAKYVTTDNGKDSARVAKWGVNIEVEGSLFENAYKDVPTTYTANEQVDTITVQSKDQADVVAPGTSNNNGMVFTLTGTPEVDTEIVFAVTADKDVVLPAGTYRDYTSADETAEFTLNDAYYPVVYTLTNDEAEVIASGNLAAIETYLEGLNKIYHTNTDLATIANGVAGTYQLTWAWAFDGAQTLNGVDFDATTVDQADTYLGNLAAGLIDNAPAGASTQIEFKVAITATQVN